MRTTTVFDSGLTHRGGWVACEQPPIMLPPILAYTRGDRDRLRETVGEEEKGLGGAQISREKEVRGTTGTAM